MCSIFKGRDGWQAEEYLPIIDNTVMRVSTYRIHNGSLVTRAQAMHQQSSGALTCRLSVFDADDLDCDYSAEIARSRPARCTRQHVEAQHRGTAGTIASHIEAARAHYAKRTERLNTPIMKRLGLES